MKGTIHKLSKGWTIWYNEDHIGGNVAFVDSLPTHPYQKFDQSVNGSEVEFEIEDFWETGLEESIKVAHVKELIKVTIKKDSEAAKSFESLRQEKKEFKENVQSGKIMPQHIREKIDKLTGELKKVYELAEQSWEGCQGCDENDKNFWMNGFQKGYYTAKPDHLSDEEIDKEAFKYVYENKISDTHVVSFIDAAKWYREKLKNRI
jgi:hypothetical protein